ncbi:MAG: acyloxyacyl hydrolase [Dolichospermum sp.]|jgi:opacity protein-like surface antigen
MNKNLCLSVFAVFATLFTTSAQAEVVSTKAADLMPNSSFLPTSKESKSSNLVAQNNEPLIGLTGSKQPASNYWYVSGSVGIASPGNDLKVRDIFDNQRNLGLDSTAQWSIAGGYQSKNYRTELELSYSSFGVNKGILNSESFPLSGNVSTTSVLVNGYYDIPTGSKFRPYLGAGFGAGIISGKVKDQGQEADLGTGSSFAYQGKVGLSYEVVKKGNAFVEFKYIGISSYKSDAGNDVSPPNSYGVNVGYRQGF